MPSTPDEVIFLAAVLVAFSSGALLVDWIRRFRDLEAQKQWHDTQMKSFQNGFGPFKELPRYLIAMQTSLDELQGKLVTVFGRFNDMSDRTDAIGRAVDHVHKHQHQDFDIKKPSLAQAPITTGSTDVSELLIGIQKIQETLIANGLGASASAQAPFAAEPVLPSLNASTSTPIQGQERKELHPTLDHTTPRLETQLSDLQKRCDRLIGKNVDLAQKLETAQAMNAEIEDNAKEAANVYWKRLVDNEILVNKDNKENIKSLEDKIKYISQHREELKQANTELRKEIERSKSSQDAHHLKAYKESLEQNKELKHHIGQAEDTIRELEQELERQCQIATDQAEVVKKQETKIATHSSEMSNLEEGLSSVVKDCMEKEGKMEKQESEIEDLKHEVLSAQSDRTRLEEESERQVSTISSLEDKLSSAQHDRTKMEQDIENHLIDISGSKDKISSAENDRTKLEEENKKLSQTHESARQPMTRQGVIIEDLRDRLKIETAKSAKIQSDHDGLAKQVDEKNAQISTLGAERLQNMGHVDRLTNQLESCEKRNRDLEGALKEDEKAREREQEAQKNAEDVSNDTPSDSPHPVNEPQPDIMKQVTSPRQLDMLGTILDEKRVEVIAPDPKAESTTSATTPTSTSGEPSADKDPITDVQGGDVVEDDTPVTNHRVAPGTGANEGLTGKRDWAEEDEEDFEFIDGVGAEMQKPIAETTLLPNATSSAQPPAQETPHSPTAEPQPALDNTTKNATPDAIVPNNDTTPPPLPNSQPPTPTLVTEYCKNCDTDVQLETFLGRDGNQQLNWRKHLKEAKCKPKLPNLFSKAQRKSGSVPPSPATPNSGT